MKSAHAVFAGLRARARVGILIEAGAVLALATVLFIAISYAADRSLELERPFRIALAAAFALLLAELLRRRALRPLRTVLDDDELALAVERVAPELRQTLISAVQFDRELGAARADTAALHGESEPLMRQVIESTERQLREVRAIRALDAGRVLRFVGVALLALAALGTWIGQFPDEAGLWWRRNLLFSGEAWPRRTALEFVGIDLRQPLRLAEREDLTLRIVARGEVPERVELRAEFDDGTRSERTCDRVSDDEFVVRLETLLQGGVVQAFGGDGRTGKLTVELVARPQLTDLQLQVSPPAYLEQEPYPADALAGTLTVVEGTRIKLTASSSKPLQSAALRLDQDRREPCELDRGGRLLRVGFVPRGDVVVGLDVIDRDDLGPAEPPQLAVRVVADAAPQLDFSSRGIGSMVTAVARIPGTLVVRDDHGVRSVAASWRVQTPAIDLGPEETAPEPPPFEPAPLTWDDALQVGSTEQSLDLTLDLLPFAPDADPQSDGNRIRPGMLLSLRFTARDAREAAEAGEPATLNLRIVTREVLMEDLQRRRDEQRRALLRVREQVVTSRDVFADILAPRADTAATDLLTAARQRIESLARRQIALGKNTADIAERYARILDELTNNRLFEPGVTRSLAQRIVDPLQRLASAGLAESADLGEAFARTGSEDARSNLVASCNETITTIDGVLAAMGRTEDIAAIVESLRLVIRTEEEAARLVEALRDEAGAGLFDDPGGDEGGGKREDGGNLDDPNGSSGRRRR